MAGLDADAPTHPWGGTEEVAVSPDGKSLVFTAHLSGRDEAWSTDYNLYQVSLDRTRSPACLTCDNPAWDTNPAFSPDGEPLAFLAMGQPGFESNRRRIRILDVASGKARTLTEEWDRSPQGVAWSRDRKSLLTYADHLGQVSLFRVDVESGRATLLVEPGTNDMPLVGADRLYYLHHDLLHPPSSGGPTSMARTRGCSPTSTMRAWPRCVWASRSLRFRRRRGDTVYRYLVNRSISTPPASGPSPC